MRCMLLSVKEEDCTAAGNELQGDHGRLRLGIVDIVIVTVVLLCAQ